MGCYDTRASCGWVFYAWLCRVLGLLTALGLWGIGIEITYDGHILGAYVIVAAFLVSLLELLFVIDFLFTMFCPGTTIMKCTQCWDGCMWIDDWKKSILYILLAVPCFIQPLDVWMPIISGMMLVFCALLYSIKTLKTRRDKILRTATRPTYDKYDEVSDDIEGSIINPTASQPIVNIADQSEILEV